IWFKKLIMQILLFNHIDASTFKIEGNIYTILKAKWLFQNSTNDDLHQNLKNFLGVCEMHKQNNMSEEAIPQRSSSSLA
ncbi:hypothetical protein HAX54_049457, partial [Datura stramonium]|nr:hypothetical protein [Datura stramonium]